MNCSCGVEIHPKRVEILKKANKKIFTCVNCSTEDKKVGFLMIDGKTERQIQILDPVTAANLEYLDSTKTRLSKE